MRLKHNQIHRIQVLMKYLRTIVYLHLVDFYGINVGKYTIHGSCADECSFSPWVLMHFVKAEREKERERERAKNSIPMKSSIYHVQLS